MVARGLILRPSLGWIEAMSDAVGPGDLVLCANAAPKLRDRRARAPRGRRDLPRPHGHGLRLPLRRPDALLDIGIDLAWCQPRFRLLPKPKFEAKPKKVTMPREKERVR